jgi:hypothetical protein
MRRRLSEQRLSPLEVKTLVLFHRIGGKAPSHYLRNAVGLAETEFDLLVHGLKGRGLPWDWPSDGWVVYERGYEPPRELEIRGEAKTVLRRLLARTPGMLRE